MKDTLVAYFQV